MRAEIPRRIIRVALPDDLVIVGSGLFMLASAPGPLMLLSVFLIVMVVRPDAMGELVQIAKNAGQDPARFLASQSTGPASSSLNGLRLPPTM